MLKLQQYLPFTVLKRPERVSNLAALPTLQQYLPFTVLKPFRTRCIKARKVGVATVLTVYGIETISRINVKIITIYVATVLTVYGIETANCRGNVTTFTFKLQQYLPFTVLKLNIVDYIFK